MKARAKPFIKWVGGKHQLLKQFENHYPIGLKTGQIKHYIEPFLGGGAVFFSIFQKYPLQTAYLSDQNPDLVLAYQTIQQNPNWLLESLEKYQKQYEQSDAAKRKELFLTVRKEFNEKKKQTLSREISDKAVLRTAQFIFLNKTCFNGLFRLNSQGNFNVPHGRYAKPAIADEENILAVSGLLQKAEIHHADYSACLDHANQNTFVYLDPPYRPISSSANFTSYTDTIFADAEQLKLAQFFRKLDKEQKAKLMLSNSDPQNTKAEDRFFETAYFGYPIIRVSASRAINSNAEKRGKITEILIRNYETA